MEHKSGDYVDLNVYIPNMHIIVAARFEELDKKHNAADAEKCVACATHGRGHHEFPSHYFSEPIDCYEANISPRTVLLIRSLPDNKGIIYSKGRAYEYDNVPIHPKIVKPKHLANAICGVTIDVYTNVSEIDMKQVFKLDW